jgi:predicted membrane-bound spermidine synthase
MTRPPAGAQPAIHAAFFLSGAGALAFETVWFSEAGLVVGNSVWAAALVVAAFMAGLAAGNAAAASIARRFRTLLGAYAAVELAAAGSGALLVLALPVLPSVLRPLFAPLLDHPVALSCARSLVAFVLMAIPATALGATLPLLARPLEGLAGTYGTALGRLYGFNTLGAVAGTLLAELTLVPALGLTGTGCVAAACSASAALIAWRLAGIPEAREAASPEKWLEGKDRARILGAAFLAGATLLGLEVVGFRFVLLFQDGTTLVFALMLAVVLAGIGLGALVASLPPFARDPGRWARRAAACAALAVVVGYAGFDAAVKTLAPWQAELTWIAGLLCAFLLGPVAFLSGALFTTLGAELRGRMAGAGAATSALTLANTLGGMLGSLAAAFLLLPLLGLERSFFVLAFFYGAIVLILPAPAGTPVRRWRAAIAAALALSLFPFGRMAGEYHRSVEERFAGRILAAREGVVQTTFYLAHDFLGEPLFLRLATNSYSMASTAVGVQRYMKLFAYLPAALHPRIERALLLCFGVGSTAAALTDLPEVKSIDVVDVSRDVLEMSDLAHPDPARHPLRDPRVKVHIEDARFFLQQSAGGYDLITGEPPPPKIAGVAALYSREYFHLMKSRLNPGGIATYWLPAYLLLERESLAIIGAFCDAFEDCSLWSGLNRDWILLGSNGGLTTEMRRVPREHFARLWNQPRAGAELRRLGIERPIQLVGQFMADAPALRKLAAAVPPLDDDHPRRIGSALYAEPVTPRYAELMNAARGRARLEGGAWAKLLDADLVAKSREGFRRRGMLEATFYPDLRGEDYDFWADLAYLLTQTDLVDLPRWMLGSGARVADIAAHADRRNPLAAEHIAIDALAAHRAPVQMDADRFAALTPKAQVVTVFHHCVAGQRAKARVLMEWIPPNRRSGDAWRAFSAWAAKAC